MSYLRFSCFCKSVLDERQNEHRRSYIDYKTEEEYIEKITEWRFEEFDKFANRLNDIFEHFSINLILTRGGFIDRQDSKIINEIYVPVLNFLFYKNGMMLTENSAMRLKSIRQRQNMGIATVLLIPSLPYKLSCRF